MGRIVLTIFFIAMAYVIISKAVKAWKKADLEEKEDRIRQINEDFQVVSTHEGDVKSLQEKSKRIEKFKKTDF